MKPLFIALEALDGVGKTTLAHSLASRLGGVATNTPGDDLRKVSPAVLGGLGPHQGARCLFYAASVLAKGTEAREAVDQGVPAVMDRYWLSTISYARARGVTADLSQVESMVEPPDVTVLLVLDEAERRRRLKRRGLTVADRETLDPAFSERVVAEMSSEDRRTALRPQIVFDVTGLGPDEALEGLVASLSSFSA